MIADRRKKPADDLTSALLEAEIDGDRLTDEEVLGFLFLMVIAGNETTTKLLANAAFWGHKNPDQLAPVYDDPNAIPLWVEETLRYDTSSQLLARTVAGRADAVRHHDPRRRRPPAAARIGHRDERVFDNPDDFVIGREIGSKLLSFGSGAHFCLGAHLAAWRLGSRWPNCSSESADTRWTRPTRSASTRAACAVSPTFP